MHSVIPGPLTDIILLAWIAQAEPGEVLEYHRGHLAVDIVPAATPLDDSHRRTLARLAACARDAATHDLIHLAQRRNGEDDFSYLAIARPKPDDALTALSALLTEEALP